MAVEPEFHQLNAAFVDRLIRRWELLMEHHYHLRYDASESAEARQQAETEVLAALEDLDGHMEGLRKRAGELGHMLPLDQVVLTYHLDPVEARILELALVPQLDLTFRQRIARFHNNILLDFVDVDLVLALLFTTRQARLQARAYLAPDAPLLANRLITLTAPKDPKGSGLMAQELRPPERLADFLLCRRSLDASLRPFAHLVDPGCRLDAVVLAEGEADNLRKLLQHFEGKDDPILGNAPPFPVGRGLAIEFAGPPGTGKTLLAHAVAGEVGRPLVQVDCGALAGVSTGFGEKVEALFSEARVQGAVLALDGCDSLLAKGHARVKTLLRQFERFGGLIVLTTAHPEDVDSGVERYVAWHVDLGMPEVVERERLWVRLRPAGVDPAEDVDIEDLATRYEITGGQIKNAWEVALRRAEAMRGDPGTPGPVVVDLEMLKAAAQAQIRANMEDYSVRSKISLTLDDLILPAKEMVLVREVLSACENRVFIMSKWGFGKRLATGKGIVSLFKGEPGTGKTLCAEILASELGMQLYQVSIPKIMSKYIGETEKNIAKIFSSARANHSMLLFDEADSLFTKRVSVENAIDRFSNMEVNLLLQEIERFEGITILTTNLDKNFDDAFIRRIQFQIEFPFPDAKHRTLIWRTLFPKECPISDNIDFDDLGQAFELSGGHIKNAVIRAAYRAAARREPVTWDDIQFAAEQECKNAGKLFRTPNEREEW